MYCLTQDKYENTRSQIVTSYTDDNSLRSQFVILKIVSRRQ